MTIDSSPTAENDGGPPAHSVHPTVCAWNEDEDGMLHTDCGKIFECMTDTPPKNGFKFCIYCGKLIGYCSYQPEVDDDE